MDQIDENLPPRADQTTVTLSQKHKERNSETARQKELEYHKKAVDMYSNHLKSQMQGLNVNQIQYSLN